MHKDQTESWSLCLKFINSRYFYVVTRLEEIQSLVYFFVAHVTKYVNHHALSEGYVLA